MKAAQLAAIAALILAAALPFLVPSGVVVLVMFLTPLASEAFRASGLRWMGLLVAILLLMACVPAGMPWQTLALGGAWCLFSLAMTLSGLRSFRRTLWWTGFSLAVLGALAVMLHSHYEGAVCHGLAVDLVNLLGARKDAANILIAALQTGLARLETAGEKLPALNLFGMVIISPEVRQELMNSLRWSIEYTLTDQLLNWAVTGVAVSALLTAWIPDLIRRKSGDEGELPPLRQWHIRREWSGGLILLMLFSLTRYVTGSMAVYQAAGMSMAAFSVIVTVQGICLAAWWLHRRREGPGHGVALAAGGILLLPLATTVLTVLGVADQLLDPRKLREQDNDDKGDEEL